MGSLTWLQSIGFHGHVSAKSTPQFPRWIVGIDGRRYDDVSALKLSSAEIAGEIIPGIGTNKCQGCFCGHKEAKKRERRSESKRLMSHVTSGGIVTGI
jgi:hypothetical protein